MSVLDPGADCMCCYGCGLIFESSDLAWGDVDADGDIPGACPECASIDIEVHDMGL